MLFLGFHFAESQSQINYFVRHFSIYDTISKNGNYVKYKVNGDSVSIEYGNKYFQHAIPIKYSCKLADARTPQFKWDNNDFICLKYGCGSPCWGVLLLPLNSKDTIRQIGFDLASDPINNMLVYLDNLEYNKLVVENLKTHDIQIIKFTKKCSSAFIGFCLDSVSIRKNKLFYRFAEPNTIDDNKKLSEFNITIK